MVLVLLVPPVLGTVPTLLVPPLYFVHSIGNTLFLQVLVNREYTVSLNREFVFCSIENTLFLLVLVKAVFTSSSRLCSHVQSVLRFSFS